MKLKSILALAIAMALTTVSSFAATYTDSSDNYEEYVTQLDSGVNNGSGFLPWEIEKHGEGDGWAGFGVWNPSANGFLGTWEGKAKAFGIIGKGPSYGVNAVRRFRAPLAAGDSFSFDMAVFWDPNSGTDALKGFVLGAGDTDVIVVDHRSNPGNIALNGDVGHDILNAFGQYPMTWTFTAVDDTTLAITATPRDGSKTVFSTNKTVSTSAIDRIRLQSARQNHVEDKEAAEKQGETPEMWADRRQTYFDNFKLELGQELPELRTFTITPPEDAWIVNEKQKIMYFTITRSNSDGELEASIEYSDAQFVSGQFWASFADGQADCTNVQVIAGVSGNANVGTMTVSAEGYEPASYDFKGPVFTFTTAEDSTTLNKGATLQCWANAKADSGFIADTNKISLLVEQEGDVVSVPETLEWNADEEQGGFYTPFEVEGLAGGTADVSLVYDGAKVITKQFTVIGKSLTWVAPTDEAWKINEATVLQEFSLTRNDAEGELTVSIESSDTSFLNASSASVTFADGVDTVSGIQVTGTISGSANFATLTASAEGYAAAEYNFSGPAFSFTTQDDATSFMVGDTLTCWANARTATGVIADTTKISLVTDPEGVVELPASLGWGDADDGGFYTEFALSGNAAGTTVVSVVYDGVSVLSKEFTVVGYDINAISGPASVYTGSDNTYTIEYLFGEETAVTVTLSDNSLGELDETSITLYPDATEYPIVFSAGDTEGTVTITVEDLNGHSASIEVTITKEPDYSSYIAYDDASLYGGNFDYDSTGAGSEGFSEWSVVEEAAEYHGIIIAGNAGDYSEILTAGSAFGLYANGNTPQFSVVRPFAEEGDSLVSSNLEPGQKASIEFLSDTGWGTRYVRFVRIYDGTPYNRFEVQDKDGAISVKVEQQGETALTLWTNKPYRLVASIELAADGSSYDLALYGYKPGSEFPDEMWKGSVDSNVDYWGDGIQGIQIGADYTEHDFIFNRLAIEQTTPPVQSFSISGPWEIWAAGDVDYTLTAPEGFVGTVNLNLDNNNGTLNLRSITYEADTPREQPFVVTAVAPPEEGELSYTITASDAAGVVSDGTFTAYIKQGSFSISGPWEIWAAGDVDYTLTAPEGFAGTVNLSIDNDNGTLGVRSLTYEANDPREQNFVVTAVAPAEDGDLSFTITASAAEGGATDATFTVYIKKPYFDLKPGAEGEPSDYTLPVGGQVLMKLYASANYLNQTFTLSSSDPSVLTVPADTLTPTDGTTEFYVTVAGEGSSRISLLAGDTELSGWGINITLDNPETPFAFPPFTVIKGKGLAFAAADLAGVTLYGTEALPATGDFKDWNVLEEGTDYEIDGEQIIILFGDKSTFFIAGE